MPTKQEREKARRDKWRWLPTYNVDPDNPDVLVSRCHGVVHRKPNDRAQLPFAIPHRD